MEGYSIFPLGDQAVTISFGNSISEQQNNKLIALKKWVDEHPFIGLLDVVVAYSSLTVIYDLFQVKSITNTSGFEFVKMFLEKALRENSSNVSALGKRIRIPVCYDDEFALDMVSICDDRKVTREEVIEIHCGKAYNVYMIGFLPGFAYMAHVDNRIAVPRKQQPRPHVAAGSVGIAGVQTGIYPVNSPGGWQIIGRTPFKLFDPTNDSPASIEAGDQVEFYPISRNDYMKMV